MEKILTPKWVVTSENRQRHPDWNNTDFLQLRFVITNVTKAGLQLLLHRENVYKDFVRS